MLWVAWHAVGVGFAPYTRPLGVHKPRAVVLITEPVQPIEDQARPLAGSVRSSKARERHRDDEWRGQEFDPLWNRRIGLVHHLSSVKCQVSSVKWQV